jgi:DNA-binding winged helix-turn-helix (wHTH) protein/TolB-like protein/tetratricopeptide (TPR) repeat protein
MLLVSRTLAFDRFRFNLPTRELLRVTEDGSEMPIPLGLRAADVLFFFLERPGELVTKAEIMQAVWPDAVVEESNLTVHISAIRRAIDDGRHGESCIQNVPRRGYRFTLGVTRGGAAPDGQGRHGLPDAPQDARLQLTDRASREALAAAPVVTASPNAAGRLIRHWRVHGAAAAAVLLIAAAAIAFVGRETPALLQPVQPPELHRASIVALPFANATGDPKDEELAAALAEDVTVDLGRIPGAYVIARSMAQTVAARKLPLSRLGSELGVRYVLEGNIRRSPDGLEFNVQLSEAASGASIWTRQVRGPAGEPGDLRSQAARTLLLPLRVAFMDTEAERLRRLPIAELTAADLIFQVAASLNHQPLSPARTAADVAKLERALQLDPGSSQLMIMLARQIVVPILTYGEYEDREARLVRARSLADQARAQAPGSEGLLQLQATILRAEGRSDEAVAAFTKLLQAHADSVPYRVELAFALMEAGRSPEAIPLLQDAIRLNRGEGARFTMYHGLGAALIRAGRSDEAIEWLRAAQQESSGPAPLLHRRLAVSYAYAGKLEDARRELREFVNLRPWQTLRWMRHSTSPAAAAAKEWNNEIAGLAVAGLRDHVPEDEDPGLPTDEGLRPRNRFSVTPIGAPGISVVRTFELKALIDAAANGQGERPLLLSTNCHLCFDIDVPGAVSVREAYIGGTLDDQAREDLKSWLDGQLNGQTSRRVITFSWNAERWNARNLALELSALGYPNVSWYRGGVEAWDVAGYPVVEKR